jgi:hypothetical protein
MKKRKTSEPKVEMQDESVFAFLQYRSNKSMHVVPDTAVEIEGLPPGPNVRYTTDGKVELLHFEDDQEQQQQSTNDDSMSSVLVEQLDSVTKDVVEKDAESETLASMREQFKGFDPFQNHVEYDDPKKDSSERLTYEEARSVVRKSFETFGIGQNLIATFDQFTEQFLPDFFARVVIIYVPNIYGANTAINGIKTSTRHRISFSDVRYFCLPKHFESNYSNDRSTNKNKIEDFEPGMLTNGKDNFIITDPIYCQRTGKTYSLPVYIDIEHEATTYENLKPVGIKTTIFPSRHICDLPIPVGTKYCSYNQPFLRPDLKALKEDVEHILPGYFIIFGKKKELYLSRASSLQLVSDQKSFEQKDGQKTAHLFSLGNSL